MYVFRHSPNCGTVEYRLFDVNLLVNRLNGSTLAVLLPMSNVTSPDVNSILSLIVSRFSNGMSCSTVCMVDSIFKIFIVSPNETLFTSAVKLSFVPVTEIDDAILFNAVVVIPPPVGSCHVNRICSPVSSLSTSLISYA